VWINFYSSTVLRFRGTPTYKPEAPADGKAEMVDASQLVLMLRLALLHEHYIVNSISSSCISRLPAPLEPTADRRHHGGSQT
jgi:hypothetical protein